MNSVYTLEVIKSRVGKTFNENGVMGLKAQQNRNFSSIMK